MSFQHKMLCLWFVCLSCGVVLSNSQVTLVTRDVVDSFRVGKDGCTNESRVCENHFATCQSDGWCMCKVDWANFRNPTLLSMGQIKEGTSYGCINDVILENINRPKCSLGAFNVIPHSQDEPATKFTIIQGIKMCSLLSASVKFPDNASYTELHWLNESYVDFRIVNDSLNFKWKISVPNLQGTLITFNLYCIKNDDSDFRPCLRAKIRGTWPKNETSPITKPNTTLTSAFSNDPRSTSTTRMATTTRMVTTPSHNSDNTSSDDDSSGKIIIIIAVVVPVVLLIVLAVVVCLLCRKKRRQRSSLKVKNTKENFRPKQDTTETFKVPEKPVSDYAIPQNLTPDIKRVEINGDFYAVPDKAKKNKDKHDGLNYLDSSALSIEGEDNISESNSKSGEPTQYADIAGVLEKI